MTQNFISFIGLFVLIGIAWLISEDRKRFPTRVVVWGLVLQLSLPRLPSPRLIEAVSVDRLSSDVFSEA